MQKITDARTDPGKAWTGICVLCGQLATFLLASRRVLLSTLCAGMLSEAMEQEGDWERGKAGARRRIGSQLELTSSLVRAQDDKVHSAFEAVRSAPLRSILPSFKSPLIAFGAETTV